MDGFRALPNRSTVALLASIVFFGCGKEPSVIGHQGKFPYGNNARADTWTIEEIVKNKESDADDYDAYSDLLNHNYPGYALRRIFPMASMPFYCNPYDYAPNIIITALNCEPYMDLIYPGIEQFDYDARDAYYRKQKKMNQMKTISKDQQR